MTIDSHRVYADQLETFVCSLRFATLMMVIDYMSDKRGQFCRIATNTSLPYSTANSKFTSSNQQMLATANPSSPHQPPPFPYVRRFLLRVSNNWSYFNDFITDGLI